jgi:flagellar hook-length control protein FliK
MTVFFEQSRLGVPKTYSGAVAQSSNVSTGSEKRPDFGALLAGMSTPGGTSDEQVRESATSKTDDAQTQTTETSIEAGANPAVLPNSKPIEVFIGANDPDRNVQSPVRSDLSVPDVRGPGDAINGAFDKAVSQKRLDPKTGTQDSLADPAHKSSMSGASTALNPEKAAPAVIASARDFYAPYDISRMSSDSDHSTPMKAVSPDHPERAMSDSVLSSRHVGRAVPPINDTMVRALQSQRRASLEFPIIHPSSSATPSASTIESALPLRENGQPTDVPKPSAPPANIAALSSRSVAGSLSETPSRVRDHTVLEGRGSSAMQSTPVQAGGLQYFHTQASSQLPTDKALAAHIRVGSTARAEQFFSLVSDTEASESLSWDPARVFSAQTPPAHPLRADLAPHVARQLVEGMAQVAHRPVEIALSPHELGRVRMSIVSEDGTITVTIVAERPETLDLMRRHVDQLGQTFRNMGYDTINFAFGRGGEGGNQGSSEQGSTASGIQSGQGDPASETTDAGESASVTIQLDNARTSGVDIRL